MSLTRRIGQLEKLVPVPVLADAQPTGPVTTEDVIVEHVAHIRHQWAFCRACKTTHVDDLCRGAPRHQPDPDGRWSWTTWRPNRAPGILPSREDLYLALVKDPAVPWALRNVPVPADLEEVDGKARLHDVWSGHWLCTVREWRSFEAIAAAKPRAWLLAIEPKHRPVDWDYRTQRHVSRSALDRYIRGNRRR